MAITIGTDPEFWLIDKVTSLPASAHVWEDRLGTKEHPLPCVSGATQVDGMAMEFNTNPVSTEEDFVSNINTVLAHIRSVVSDKFDFSFAPVVVFPEEVFAMTPDENKLLGCSPDFNAWYGGKANDAPLPPDATPTMRTASGHIHVGVDDPDNLDRIALVKELDAVLYPMSTLWDKDKSRSEVYGSPGSFRTKPYGLEYRVLSNVWLSSPDLVRYVYRVTNQVVENFNNGVRIVTEKNFHPSLLTDESIGRWINNVLVAEYKFEVPNVK